MQVPITGIILIPLGLFLVLLPWRYCLYGLVPMAMMSPAAVVNVGSFGLQPGYYFSILLTGRTLFEIMIDGYRLDAQVLARLRFIFFFLINAFLVLFLALCFFQGRIHVLPGNLGYRTFLVRPFRMGRENFTQLAYLMLNISMLYCMGHHAARRSFQSFVIDWDRAIVIGLIFSAIVCAWQFLSFYAGLPFPTDFFYSNAGYVRADDQQMAGLLRLNGPFEEPSALGYNFTGYLLFAWVRYRLYPTAFTVFLMAASIVSMIFSTSTTSLFGIGVFGLVWLYDIFSARIYLLAKNFKFNSGQLAAIIIIVVGVLGGAVIVLWKWQQIHSILDQMLLHKTSSGSFHDREFAELIGIHAFIDSYGIGVGLGSHKPNGLVVMLLSNLGVAGFLLFGAFIATLLRPLPLPLDPRTAYEVRRRVRPFQWGMIGLLIIHAFTNPNLSTLAVWVNMAGVLALRCSLRNTVAALTTRRAAETPPSDAIAAIP